MDFSRYMQFESLLDVTGKDKNVLPIKNYKVYVRYEGFYDRVYELREKYGDNPEINYLENLLIDSLMYYNYKFATTNNNGKDVKYMEHRNKQLERLRRKGKI